jgi:hypothetical protein
MQVYIFRFDVPVYEQLVQRYKAFGDADNQEVPSSNPDLCKFWIFEFLNSLDS